MDRLHLMTVFVAVAEEEGFAAAARRLKMSPPAVTRAVAALEERLADPALYAGKERALLDELHHRQSELVACIETAELRWLEVHEMLESMSPE